MTPKHRRDVKSRTVFDSKVREVEEALDRIWKADEHPCSKRVEQLRQLGMAQYKKRHGKLDAEVGQKRFWESARWRSTLF
jgi:hypothetical protein